MSLLTRLFPHLMPPEPEETEDQKVVTAKNERVRSVIDETLDAWNRDLAQLKRKPDDRYPIADMVREGGRQR